MKGPNDDARDLSVFHGWIGSVQEHVFVNGTVNAFASMGRFADVSAGAFV
jgi:hypothetical protein